MYSHPRLSSELSSTCVESPISKSPQRKQARSQNADEAAFRTGLVNLMPFLDSFSLTLCRDRELAKDLAQEALCKAWQARASFRPGTNLKAWLFTIFRNLLHSHHRRAWREGNYDEETVEQIADPNDPQDWAVLTSDTVRALNTLPPEQRQALILVTLGGLTYIDAAPICGCVVGTLKSRVARGREKVLAALDNGKLSSVPRPPAGCGSQELMRALQTAMAHGYRQQPPIQAAAAESPAPLSNLAA